MASEFEKIEVEQLNGECAALFEELTAQPDDPDLLARLCYELNIRSYHGTSLELGCRRLGRVDEAHEFWYEVLLAVGLNHAALADLAVRFKDRLQAGLATPGFLRNLALLHLTLGEDERGCQLLDRLRSIDHGDLDSRTYELFAQSEFADRAFEACIATCDKAIRAEGPSARVIRLKGRCYLELDDLDRAKRSFRDALDSEPNFVRACLSMAILYLEQRRLDQALRFVGKAMAINPTFSGNYILLAEAFIDMKRLDLAEAEYRLLLLLQPDPRIRAEVHNALGYILRKKECFIGAREELHRALELDPELAVAHYNLGCVAYRENDVDLAQRHFHSALSIDPGHVESLVKLGLLNKSQKHLDKAEAYFRKALDVNPHQAQAYLGLSELAQAKGATEAQLRDAQLAYQYAPENTDICNNLGIAYECLGRLDEAEAAYLKAIDIDPFHAQAANNLGYLFEKKMVEDPDQVDKWKDRAIAAWKIRYQICHQTQRSIKGATEHLLKLGLTDIDIDAIGKLPYPPDDTG